MPRFSQLLFTTNRHTVGGREVFCSLLAGQLRQSHGIQARLLARAVHAGSKTVSAFADCIETGNHWDTWMREGEKHLGTHGMVWAQHEDLLPAWILASSSQSPLATLFHGPLLPSSGPMDEASALGMTLALHRGQEIAAVSEEVASQLGALVDHREIALVRNPIQIQEGRSFAPCDRQALRLAWFGRLSKLRHLRQCVLLAHQIAAISTRPVELVLTGGDHTRADLGQASLLDTLGRKWCLRQGPSLLAFLSRVRLRAPLDDISPYLADADAVLGMGRVLLEATARDLPCVLVGYHSVHGLLDETSFSQWQRTNFSGRGAAPAPLNTVARALLKHLESCAGAGPVREQVADQHELRRVAAPIAQRFQRLASTQPEGTTEAKVCREKLADGAQLEDLQESLITSLRPNETCTFQTLRNPTR